MKRDEKHLFFFFYLALKERNSDYLSDWVIFPFGNRTVKDILAILLSENYIVRQFTSLFHF